MFTYLPRLPDNADDLSKCECDCCGATCEAWECEPIEDFHKVFKAGATVPAGSCPHCNQGLVYLED